MSAKMLERYSHTRNQAKREAVNKLPQTPSPRKFRVPTISPTVSTDKGAETANSLNLNGGRGGNRTHNPRLRRPVLYPIELLARKGRSGIQVYCSGNRDAEHGLP